MKYVLILLLMVSCKDSVQKKDEPQKPPTKTNTAAYCNYELPKNWRLLFNEHTKEYVLKDKAYELVRNDLYLGEYDMQDGLWMRDGVWLDTGFLSLDKAFRRKDTCELKLIASEYLTQQDRYRKEREAERLRVIEQKRIDSLNNDFK